MLWFTYHKGLSPLAEEGALADQVISHIIYRHPATDRLLLSPERQVITRLLQEGHDYALFIFSDREQENWHFCSMCAWSFLR